MQLHTLLILATMVIEVTMVDQCDLPFMWVDRSCPEARDKEAQIDTFFDRVVGILIENDDGVTKAVNTGVYISNQLILSSSNAYSTLRTLRHTTLDQILIVEITGRQFDTTGKFLSYKQSDLRITCAKQVILKAQNESASRKQMFTEHDLIVMRVSREAAFLNRTPPRRFDFSDYKSAGHWNSNSSTYEVEAGPIQTDVAKPGDEIGEDLKFASLGHLNEKHVDQHRFLELGKVEANDITNCEEWIPREWGYFICVLNVHKYPGLASGAMLFSGDKLFGVGSYALWKGSDGVLIFTDVRPYWGLMKQKCTEPDED